MGVGGILLVWTLAFVPGGAVGAGTLSVWLLIGSAASVAIVFWSLVIITGTLTISSSHANITSNAYAASLLGDGPAEGRGFGQTWELLCTIHGEHVGLHFHSPVERCVGGTTSNRLLIHGGLLVRVVKFLGLLVEVEAQAISPFVTDGQIWEDEVTRLGRTVKICHSRHGHTCQDGDLLRWWLGLTTRVGDTGYFQRSEEEEIGFVGKCDILSVRAFAQVEYAQFHDGWGIHRSAIGRCFLILSVGPAKRRLAAQYIHFAPDPQALARSGCWITFN
jgi:hypothetical protein